jgi:CDP-glucose 4,6-dehydratase
MDTNVGGTVNVLEAVRMADCVKAVVCITSDKCYENQGWFWGYRENDQLGGCDPYSASKGMAELAISAYRRSFFPTEKYSEHGVAIASTRAGNVIGGGDFAEYRLVPDCMRALMEGKPILVRNPDSVRPWQDVLEPLSGYLWLAVKLLESGATFSEAWNYGPMEPAGITTREVAEKAIELWGSGSWVAADSGESEIEVGVLRLNWDKAASRLGWRPAYTWEESLAETIRWSKLYVSQRDGGEEVDLYDSCVAHIEKYTERSRALGVEWAVLSPDSIPKSS